MRYLIYVLMLPLLLQACSPNEPASDFAEQEVTDLDSATWIVRKAIARHGGEQLQHSRIAFDFRERHYVSERLDGQYTYERIWQDTSGDNYRDVLTNTKLYREINGQQVKLTAKDSSAYANSVNSVIYFALLPYFLEDPAAQKSYLGKGSIKDQEYHKIQVTFRPEGGGKDFEDEFVYWIHPADFTMDYLAYNYITDGGGARFREAYHVREISGIRFADFINYEPVPDSRVVADFDSLYDAGAMKELSRIDLENIEVELF